MNPQSAWRSLVQIISPDAPSRAYVCPYTVRLDAAIHCLQGHTIHWTVEHSDDGKPIGRLCIGRSIQTCRFPRLGYAEYVIARRLVRWVTTVAMKAGWV